MIGDKYIKKTSPRSLLFFISELFGGVFYTDLKSFVWRRHVGAPPRDTNMAAIK